MVATEPESRPLSTVAAVGLAGFTAAMVIGGGVLVVERGARPGPAAVAAPPAPVSTSASVSASVSVSAEPPAEAPAPVIAREAATAATAATTAKATTTSSAAVTPPSADELPPQFGYLTVRGKGEARVYVTGVDLGPLDQALKAPCGLKYVRLGTATKGAHPPSWLSPGQSVAIACRASTEIAAPAGR